MANLMLALFALVAIESGSQSLGRAYVGLLALALVLDILWFILFTSEIRYSSWLFLVLIKVHLKSGFLSFLTNFLSGLTIGFGLPRPSICLKIVLSVYQRQLCMV